jgi:hypothetical protein
VLTIDKKDIPWQSGENISVSGTNVVVAPSR